MCTRQYTLYLVFSPDLKVREDGSLGLWVFANLTCTSFRPPNNCSLFTIFDLY